MIVSRHMISQQGPHYARLKKSTRSVYFFTQLPRQAPPRRVNNGRVIIVFFIY